MDMVGAGSVPVPETLMILVPVTLLSIRFNWAERAPAALGLNTIPMVQLRPAGSTALAVSMQLVVSGSMAKSAGLVPEKNGAAERISALLPVFATLNDLATLVVPLIVLLKI